MLCDEKKRLMWQYASAIDHWVATLDDLHCRIGLLPSNDYDVFLARALQARDEWQTRKRRLEAHKISHGC